MLSSTATSAIEPIFMRIDRPVIEAPSCGTPHSGPMRGNSTNISAMIGAPSSAVRAARPPASRKLGCPTGMCASTRPVNKPHTDTSIAAATPSDCE